MAGTQHFCGALEARVWRRHSTSYWVFLSGLKKISRVSNVGARNIFCATTGYVINAHKIVEPALFAQQAMSCEYSRVLVCNDACNSKVVE